ncbi:MAG: sulfatase [Thermomicrobiales bacterium]|jgi:hypothetical protein|nr:sulfatase [Thermomicrobiales bacterium]MDF3015354.1 sulfatase [Thermomicrobiales bacterium]
MGLKGARSGGGSWDAGLYHLNAYTYADPTWFPDMDPELRAMFARVTKGSLSGKAGETEGGLQDQRSVRRHAR